MNPLYPPPFQVLHDSWLADAYWRYLVRVGIIKPRKSKRAHWFIGWVGNPAKGGRANPVAAREMNIVLKHTMKRGRGNKRNPQLFFELAKWCIQIGKIPTRALKDHYRDTQLFDILLRHGAIPSDTVWWDAISAQDKSLLEKRLHHSWPVVSVIVKALKSSNASLRVGKPPSQKKRPIRISKQKPLNAWGIAVSNIQQK